MKRQALRVLILVGVTTAIAQTLQAMGLVGLNDFTGARVVLALFGVAVALVAYAALKEEYRKQAQENHGRPVSSRRQERG